MMAVQNDDHDALQELVSRGGDINCKYEKWGNTLLMEASKRGQLQLVKLLTREGA